jgi:hypothetical protein
MERLKELITQLKEQFDRKAEPSQMLETAKLLQAELQVLATQPAPAKAMPTKITVMMPSATKINTGQSAAQSAPAARKEPDVRKEPEPRKEPAPQRNGVANVPSSANAPSGAAPASVNGTPAINGNPPLNGTPAVPASPYAPVPKPETPVEVITLEKPVERGQWPFDPLAEKPTDRFTLSQRSREVNDVIGNTTTSLNDKLKSEVADLKSALNDTPVRDLKKAIGVNDRYVFINQLFRGDEVMYERSLKTINGFRILPEAEYWMERELKVKLGWDENREATRHFYQLVKRRFS